MCAKLKRVPGRPLGGRLPSSVREAFWRAVRSGATPSGAARSVGISGVTGLRWCREAGYVSRHVRSASPEVRELFWQQLRGGASVADAAAAAGVSEASGFRWAREAGGVANVAKYRDTCPVALNGVADATVLGSPASDAEPPPGAALSFTERCRIEELLTDGQIPAQIARLLGRHRSTIAREIARGMTSGGSYRAIRGQCEYETRMARPKVRRFEANPALLAEVLSGLKKRYSPRQIAGRLRLNFPDDPEMWVSHETIYQAIYVQPRGELARLVKAALRTGRIKRKPQGRQALQGRGKLKDMISISDRPKEVDDRAIPGHWEGDLIVGANNASAIGTLVERTTGFVLLLHLPGDHTAETVATAMIAKMPALPEILWRSLTWDQGREMALHTKITEATGLPIYFCDPHSPWQRGSNENTNGLLRQYFPKGTDLSFHGPGILDNVAAELNGRPRERFGWKTPAEMLDKLLSDPNQSVAATA
jgi:transposase, IS30 family